MDREDVQDVATENTVSADFGWGDFPAQMGIRR